MGIKEFNKKLLSMNLYIDGYLIKSRNDPTLILPVMVKSKYCNLIIKDSYNIKNNTTQTIEGYTQMLVDNLNKYI